MARTWLAVSLTLLLVLAACAVQEGRPLTRPGAAKLLEVAIPKEDQVLRGVRAPTAAISVDCAQQENLITTRSHTFYKGMYVLAPTAAGEQFYVVPREFGFMPNRDRQLSAEFGTSRPRPKAVWLVLKAPYKITVTGIEDRSSTKIVEFEVSYDLSSPRSSQLSRCIAANRSVGEAHFALYDDGWRLAQITNLDVPFEDRQRVEAGAGAPTSTYSRERLPAGKWSGPNGNELRYACFSEDGKATLGDQEAEVIREPFCTWSHERDTAGHVLDHGFAVCKDARGGDVLVQWSLRGATLKLELSADGQIISGSFAQDKSLKCFFDK